MLYNIGHVESHHSFIEQLKAVKRFQQHLSKLTNFTFLESFASVAAVVVDFSAQPNQQFPDLAAIHPFSRKSLGWKKNLSGLAQTSSIRFLASIASHDNIADTKWNKKTYWRRSPACGRWWSALRKGGGAVAEWSKALLQCCKTDTMTYKPVRPPG